MKNAKARALAKLQLFFATKREISLGAEKVYEACKSARACRGGLFFATKREISLGAEKVHGQCKIARACQVKAY